VKALLLLALVLLLALAACGGSTGTGTDERLESSLDASVDAALGDEGLGDARNVECVPAADAARFVCRADVPLGPDVFRETYRVTVDGTCWQAQAVELERLTGRDTELAVPHRLEGCF
jgi:hypothetical protein